MKAVPCSSETPVRPCDMTVMPLGCTRNVIDMQAEFYGDVELLRRGADKRGLQVAAMNDPVGRAVTRRGRLPERHAHDFAAALAVENAQRPRAR